MKFAAYQLLIKPIEILLELVYAYLYHMNQSTTWSLILAASLMTVLFLPLLWRAEKIRFSQLEKKRGAEGEKPSGGLSARLSAYRNHCRKAGYCPLSLFLPFLLEFPLLIASCTYFFDFLTFRYDRFFGICTFTDPSLPWYLATVALLLVGNLLFVRRLARSDQLLAVAATAVFAAVLYQRAFGVLLFWAVAAFLWLLCNLFRGVRHARLVFDLSAALCGVINLICFFFYGSTSSPAICIPLLVAGCCPLLFSGIRAALGAVSKKREALPARCTKTEKITFFFGCISLFLLSGCVIPLSVISASPAEFVSTDYGPFFLVCQTALAYAGIFLVWLGLIFLLTNEKAKKILSGAIGVTAVLFAVDAIFFGKYLGTMSPYLVYDETPVFSLFEQILNIAVLLLLLVGMLFSLRKAKKIIPYLSGFLMLGLLTFSVGSGVLTFVQMANTAGTDLAESEKIEPVIHLSRDGENVVVIMLDRAIGGFVPYAMEEYPELSELYDGFTYYPNTLSFGAFTNFATPALFGGYEYTPVEINKRDEELLKDKQNEALSVMPRIFSDAGYEVTVLDPPYANYLWNSDVSIYDSYEGINAAVTEGKYLGKSMKAFVPYFEGKQKSNFLCYSIMKMLPTPLRGLIYANGVYFGPKTESSNSNITQPFLNSYSVLDALPQLTEIEEGDTPTFLMMQNSVTHEPVLLNGENLTPSLSDTTRDYPESYTVNGKTMRLQNESQIAHYETNVAALLRIGEWMQGLRDAGVYDNTKIIIVSDHGRALGQFDEMKFDSGIDVEFFNPLLLVKDFGATGFTVCEDFMTNADTPTLATEGSIENPVNPFTGHTISSKEKENPQILTTSCKYSVNTNNGTTFDTEDGEWWSVEENIFHSENWKKLGKGGKGAQANPKTQTEKEKS